MGNPPEAPGTRPCPYCGEPFGGTPRVCPHCEEDLSPAIAGPIARRIAAETRGDAAAGDFEDPPAGAMRPWRTGTIVAASCLLLSILLILLAVGLPPGGRSALAGTLGGMGATFSFLCLLLLGLQDLALGNPARAGDPLTAARIWTKALSQKRWALAFHMTLPRGRTDDRPNALADALGTGAAGTDYSSVEGFRDAWKPVLHGGDGVLRKSSFGKFALEKEKGDCAEVSCTLTVNTRDAFVGIGGDTVHFPLTLRLLAVRGRWYIVDGAPCPEQPLED